MPSKLDNFIYKQDELVQVLYSDLILENECKAKKIIYHDFVSQGKQFYYVNCSRLYLESKRGIEPEAFR